MKNTRVRHRITTAAMTVSGRDFILTFRPDGLHVHEKNQRAKTDRLLPLAQLALPAAHGAPAGARANPNYKNGSPSEHLDLAANDLCRLAEEQHGGRRSEKAALVQVKTTVLKAVKIIRSLELLAD